MSRTLYGIFAVTAVALVGGQAAAETVRVSVPDRAEFGIAYGAASPEGSSKRTAAFVDIAVHYHLFTRKGQTFNTLDDSERTSGFGFWDMYSLRAGIGKMLSTPVDGEFSFCLDFVTGYQLLAGVRTGTSGVFGGIGAEYGMVWIGDAQVKGFSVPLIARGELMLGERMLEGAAWASFIGSRKGFGAEVTLPLSRRWALFGNAAYASGDDAVGSTPTMPIDGYVGMAGIRQYSRR